jgi:integrase
MSALPDDGRQCGRIEARGVNLRVVVYAGQDPVTGRRSYLRETVKGNDKPARKRANKVMTRLLARSTSSVRPRAASPSARLSTSGSGSLIWRTAPARCTAAT